MAFSIHLDGIARLYVNISAGLIRHVINCFLSLILFFDEKKNVIPTYPAEKEGSSHLFSFSPSFLLTKYMKVLAADMKWFWDFHYFIDWI